MYIKNLINSNVMNDISKSSFEKSREIDISKDYETCNITFNQQTVNATTDGKITATTDGKFAAKLKGTHIIKGNTGR